MVIYVSWHGEKRKKNNPKNKHTKPVIVVGINHKLFLLLIDFEIPLSKK